MKRKTFIRGTLPVITAPLFLNGLMLEGCYPRKRTQPRGKVLVLVQLDGGNDGLSSIIPVDQYRNLSKARNNVLIPENQILSLNNTSVTGFHPAMTELQSLYNNKQLTVIQGVGYPDPVFSHFRAIDIWHTGSGAATVLNSGWIGRFLEKEFPDYPKGYPNQNSPDPPAMQIGAVISNALLGSVAGMGMAVESTVSFYDLILGSSNAPENTHLEHELTFISTTASQTRQYMGEVKKAAQAQRNLSARYPAPGTNPLADQLKIAAQLIGGGLQTKVYMVNLMGFDTHHNQVKNGDHTKGTHAELLLQLSEAVAAFEDDLHLMGKIDDVLGMTYSEFGRRIMSNASGGTDHGSSGPVILFGSKLKGGMLGTNPEIPGKVNVEDNLAMQFDFRSVYSSVLKGWFGIPDSVLDYTMPGKFPVMDLFA